VNQLRQGQNLPLGNPDSAIVEISWAIGASLDVSCFMVQSDGKVPSDDYMIFYNQPKAPDGSVKVLNSDLKSIEFELFLDRIPTEIQRCVLTATVESGTFSNVSDLMLVASSSGGIEYFVEKSGDEKALIIAEIYRHNSAWKIRAVNQGFNGGLAPLARHHGVQVDEEPAAATPPPTPVQKVKKVNLTKIDLLKEKVVVSLEKKKLTGEKARLCVVLDASGSMGGLFSSGVVQRAFEKALAVAACMDDNGMVDVWFFADGVLRAPSATEADFEGYVKRIHSKPGNPIGYGNNEPAVIVDVIRKYIEEEPDPTVPVYVLFFSDGGIYYSEQISKLLTESSFLPIFWQFIGLGNADYGILRKLDTLPGRLVDNAGFFSLDDLDKVSDEELYDRILSEYPEWLKTARAKGVIGPKGLKSKVDTSGSPCIVSPLAAGKKRGFLSRLFS
jgi:stress response protein SCP2